jgi:hypothetical protein
MPCCGPRVRPLSRLRFSVAAAAARQGRRRYPTDRAKTGSDPATPRQTSRETLTRVVLGPKWVVLSIRLVALTSTSARAASFRPEVEIAGRGTRACRADHHGRSRLETVPAISLSMTSTGRCSPAPRPRRLGRRRAADDCSSRRSSRRRKAQRHVTNLADPPVNPGCSAAGCAQVLSHGVGDVARTEHVERSWQP